MHISGRQVRNDLQEFVPEMPWMIFQTAGCWQTAMTNVESESQIPSETDLENKKGLSDSKQSAGLFFSAGEVSQALANVASSSLRRAASLSSELRCFLKAPGGLQDLTLSPRLFRRMRKARRMPKHKNKSISFEISGFVFAQTISSKQLANRRTKFPGVREAYGTSNSARRVAIFTQGFSL